MTIGIPIRRGVLSPWNITTPGLITKASTQTPIWSLKKWKDITRRDICWYSKWRKKSSTSQWWLEVFTLSEAISDQEFDLSVSWVHLPPTFIRYYPFIHVERERICGSHEYPFPKNNATTSWNTLGVTVAWILPANNHMKVCPLPETETPLEKISTGFKGIRLMWGRWELTISNNQA